MTVKFKMSEKGLDKAGQYYCNCCDCFGYDDPFGRPREEPKEPEFEPDDLEGCVVLTVEEAKEILQSSYDVLSWASCPYIHENTALKVQTLLKNRINRVEIEK